MKRYLVLAYVLCFLVGCGAEPVPTAAPPTEASIGDTWTRPADGMEMVFVPAGEFLMGSAGDDPDADDDEKPQHTVYLDAFWIDRTEVTNAQYRKCVEAGACEEPMCPDESDLKARDQPVVCVTWDNAQEYAAWAGGRLPTEAEWEKAARGTDGQIYPWGNSVPDCDKAHYLDCADLPLPVGSHPDGASPYGVLDMAGNAVEWVADWYDEDYYSQSPFRNPQGPESGSFHVLRGGSFWDGERRVRCAFRLNLVPNYWQYNLGFRLVVAPSPSAPMPTATPMPTAAPMPTATPMPTAAPPTGASIGDTWTRPADGAVMVYVPAGEFLMGSTDEEVDDLLAECAECPQEYRELLTIELPQHAVYLDAFWIDKTEVTNAQYRTCVEAGVCTEPDCWDVSDGLALKLSAPDKPVVCVRWNDAQAYATWVGGRLPTEAEWEKAARGTEGRLYPWGDTFDSSKANFCDRNCTWDWKDTSADDGYELTAPVGSYPAGASPYGALDMAGNVLEWVADWYDEAYYSKSPSSDPQGPDSGDARLARGGSMDWHRLDVRCAARDAYPPDHCASDIGFRVCVAARQD